MGNRSRAGDHYARSRELLGLVFDSSDYNVAEALTALRLFCFGYIINDGLSRD